MRLGDGERPQVTLLHLLAALCQLELLALLDDVSVVVEREELDGDRLGSVRVQTVSCLELNLKSVGLNHGKFIHHEGSLSDYKQFLKP